MKPNDLPTLPQVTDPVELALRKRGLSDRYIASARRRSAFTGDDLATSLRKQGLASSELLASAIAEAYNLEYRNYVVMMAHDYRSVSHLPCTNPMTGVPLELTRADNGVDVLTVAVHSDSADLDSNYLSYQIRKVIASTRSLGQVYRRVFAGTERIFVELAAQRARLERGEKGTDDGKRDEESAIIPKMFIALLRHASYMGASDIQLSVAGEYGNIRIVVDGTGRDLATVSRDTIGMLITVAMRSTARNEDSIKADIFGDATFSEEGLSSELLQRDFDDLRREFDYRLNFGNEYAGQSLTLRLLTRDSESQEFDQLGFDREDHERILKATRANSGLVIVTGPTGSSKTTTVFSMLNRIDPIERSIQTIENPVEYTHPMWLQYDLKGAGGVGEDVAMEKALRGMLRNAPNVISIAEVRSPGGVKTMMRAAATGHLVFTTLHADDAPMAIYMLRNHESKDEDIASNLQLVIAVRLVRQLCPACRKPEDRKEMWAEISELAGEIGETAPHRDLVYRAHEPGCEQCSDGYRGRRLIYELLENSAVVAKTIRSGGSIADVRQQGIEPKKSIRGRAFFTIRAGKTSVDEALRVIPHRRY